MEHAADVADQGTTMATTAEEEAAVAEAAVPTSFGAFAALNGAAETVRMLMHVAMQHTVACRFYYQYSACKIVR